MNNKPLFIYHDTTTIYPSDLNCFNSSYWLNDTCIQFCYKYLEISTENAKSNIKLKYIEPCTIYIIMHERDREDLYNTIDSVTENMEGKDLVMFCPINDDGNTHWSLLLILIDSTKKIYFYYLDSSGNYNISYAKKLAKILLFYFFDKNQTNHKFSPTQDSIVNIVPSKQQNNSNDCGVFTIAYTEIISQYLYKNNNINSFFNMITNFESISNNINIENDRKKWHNIITNLSKNIKNV